MSKYKFKVTSDFIVNSLCALTISSGAVEYSINTFLNSKVRRYKEVHKNGKPVALSESLQKQFDNVFHDLKLTDFQKPFARAFTVEGFNTVNIGCLNTRTGCFIGIPTTYDLNSIDDVANLESQELMSIQLLNDNSESGQKFMETLILSEPAKKFSIARELVLTDNFRLFIKSISMTVTLIPMYAFGSTLLNLLPANSFRVKVLAFFLLSNIGVFLWLAIRKTIEDYYQINADHTLCKISEEYINGGIEYYDKLIERNLALRSIIPNGQTMYAENGDDLSLFSLFSELSFTYRKKCLENQLKIYKNNNNDTLK